MISWETCKKDFRSDGSLRDIYITQVKLADWRIIYSLLRDFPAVEFAVNGIAQPLPTTVEHVFAIKSSGSPMLRLRVGPALVVFHFFSEDEIECDFRPQEIASQTDLDGLFDFISQLGNATRKRVIITPENAKDYPFITYDPEGRVFEQHA